MAEEEIYANADVSEMCPSPQVGEEHSIYANVRPEDAVASKPSGPVRNYSRWATGSLGLLCVLLLALSIALSFKYVKERGQLQAETEHLLAGCVDIKEQLLANNTNLTRQVDQLRITEGELQDRIAKLKKRCPSGYMDITMEREQLLANNTNLTRQVDQLRITEGELQDRIAKLKKRCPSGWIYFNTKCYLIDSSKKTWTESRTYCQTHGADLVIISSREEQVFIYGLRKSVWIGLRKEQGQWEWVNNTKLSSSFWEKGQPNNHPPENCTLLFSKASNPLFSWHDYPCNDQQHFTCKISAYM
ncbi:hypothetical protein ACEWY4_018194 [Coilia grayii]|uniref:C-type lectin domain-containing protein n=1 Tax=Coilia grayii TaxID=363190 RepID=A0ABD1JL82_9TELE